ncbi:GSCFA domain-containing protein [Flavobacterium sp.]|uniref:GSCFA domain-containing protein n=1 Tax=Flavobacterium sp. TaxID=239 RepID=UPI00261560FC|nr:GSCFA domain-containing protein [Flavobacterium sp.]MDD3005304.1 GSCFA domain-containing protein [Flavobacterium sp.]
MHFFTKIPVSVASNPIDYQSRIVSIGSCFAENMGQKFDYYKFNSSTNPFGIIFNAIALQKIIQRAVLKESFTKDNLIFYNDCWHCYDVHSQFSHPDPKTLLKNLNDTLALFLEKITQSTHFIITLGTSWVYKTVTTNQVVANCHKIPQKEFTKYLLSSTETLESISRIIQLVSTVNSGCNFIFTISPVRHIKDGFFENQVSKSNLFAAINDLMTKPLPHKNLHYFPAFEIMMDELRDYRFYNQDLIHPNSTAIDYIWSRFLESHITSSSLDVLKEVDRIQKSLNHRPFNSNSASHQDFLHQLKLRMEKISADFPHIKF